MPQKINKYIVVLSPNKIKTHKSYILGNWLPFLLSVFTMAKLSQRSRWEFIISDLLICRYHFPSRLCQCHRKQQPQDVPLATRSNKECRTFFIGSRTSHCVRIINMELLNVRYKNNTWYKVSFAFRNTHSKNEVP